MEYDNNSYRIKLGTILSTGTRYGANRIYCNGLFRFLSTHYTDEIATFHRIDNYDDPIHATEHLYKKNRSKCNSKFKYIRTTLNNNNSGACGKAGGGGAWTLCGLG